MGNGSNQNATSRDQNGNSRSSKATILFAVAAIATLIITRQLGCFGETVSLARIAAVLALMVAMLRFRLDIGVVLLLSAAALGWVFRLPLERIAREFVFDVGGDNVEAHRSCLKAINLIVIIYLINALGRAMRESGSLAKLIQATEHMTRDLRYVAAALPAAIGLLPMPGGAMLSAPFVEEVAERTDMSAIEKTMVNYWFRHIWEYSWPLYPAIIAASQLLDRPIGKIMLAQSVMTILSMLVGFLFILRRIRSYKGVLQEGATTRSCLRTIVMQFWPVLFVAFCVGVASERVPQPWRDLVFPCALVLVNVAVVALAQMRWRKAREILLAAPDWKMVVLVLGIYIMRDVLNASGATEQVPTALQVLRIPLFLVIFMVPFVIGLLTGYSVAGVSMAFPVLANFLGNWNGVLLAYTGAFLGVQLSPVHLCLILTAEYFKADLAAVYRRLIPLVALMSVFAVLLWLLPIKG